MSSALFQGKDVQLDASCSNSSSRGSVCHFLLPHVNLHDLQRLALHSSCIRGRSWVLSFWLAAVDCSGSDRALPLVKGKKKSHLYSSRHSPQI
jgi:hypothetical protein